MAGTTTFHSFRDLLVWQRAMQMVETIYKLTKQFPKEELYGLTSQMRRNAVSIPCTIAQGKGMRTRKEFLSSLRKAQSTSAELDTQIEIAKGLHGEEVGDFKKAQGLLTEVEKMLHVLARKMQPARKTESAS